jgi:ribonuclease T2
LGDTGWCKSATIGLQVQRFVDKLNLYRFGFLKGTAMSRLRKIIPFVLCLITSSAIAGPSCSIAPGKKLYYQLTLTESATFCKSHSNDISCKNLPSNTVLQMHGLWPDYAGGGFPQGNCDGQQCPSQPAKKGAFCKYPEPPGLYNSEVWRTEQSYMAGVASCLERHEWVKHGTCTPMSSDPVAYFGWALGETKRIVQALNPPANTPIAQSALNATIKAKLADLDGALTFQCEGSNVSQIVIKYQWGNKPGAVMPNPGGGNGFGNCPDMVVFPTRQ